ncbi:MAG: hypothetical protein II328_02775, partial [Clostridia bacterium]|nr:hypothetical protein [Clostridia bacterium]
KSEWEEAKRLMRELRKAMKRDMDDRLAVVDARGKSFDDISGCLRLVVTDQGYDESALRESGHYVLETDGFFVCVKLYNKNVTASLLLTDDMVFYWDTAERAVWEAAFANEIINESRDDLYYKRMAKEAMRRIRELYPVDAVAEEVTPTEEKKTAKPASPTPPTKKKSGCYIATAVYGSYDAPEVLTLRRFRDETLSKSIFGRCFIRVYYFLSPPIAEWLKGAKRLNGFVRRLLDKWVDRLNKKYKK